MQSPVREANIALADTESCSLQPSAAAVTVPVEMKRMRGLEFKDFTRTCTC
jgi:hypothetical protein